MYESRDEDSLRLDRCESELEMLKKQLSEFKKEEKCILGQMKSSKSQNILKSTFDLPIKETVPEPTQDKKVVALKQSDNSSIKKAEPRKEMESIKPTCESIIIEEAENEGESIFNNNNSFDQDCERAQPEGSSH